MADTNDKPTLSWSQPQASTTKPAAGSGKPAVTPVTPVPPVKNTAPTAAAAADSSSNMGTYAGIFVAGVIIGALIGWGITSGNNSGSTSTTASSTAEMTGSTTTSGATGSNVDLSGSTIGTSGNITLATTQQAGFAVAVSKAVVNQPTWLVVYENHNGAPGNAIGAGLFFPATTNGTIQLLRATLPGQSYFVGQSLDDGDKIFSLATDKPVSDAQGNPLFTEFTAQ